MNKNLHAYRNLGVPCLSLLCGNCEKETAFSAYFETNAKRQKACSLGCCECGRGYEIPEDVYDGLYELSFEYDRWKAGKLSADEFRKFIPDSCQAFLQSSNAQSESSESEDGASSVPKPLASDEKGAAKEKAVRPRVILRNSLADLLGTGITLAVLFGIVFFGVSFVVELPEWAVGWWRVATYMLVMGIGLLAGIAMCYKRFPIEVMIETDAIEVSIRGSREKAKYPLSDVSRVNYGEGAKYLTLWLSDGKTYVVKATPQDVILLHGYFGKIG